MRRPVPCNLPAPTHCSFRHRLGLVCAVMIAWDAVLSVVGVEENKMGECKKCKSQNFPLCCAVSRKGMSCQVSSNRVKTCQSKQVLGKIGHMV
jgi:hypothetical protein